MDKELQAEERERIAAEAWTDSQLDRGIKEWARAMEKEQEEEEKATNKAAKVAERLAKKQRQDKLKEVMVEEREGVGKFAKTTSIPTSTTN